MFSSLAVNPTAKFWVFMLQWLDSLSSMFAFSNIGFFLCWIRKNCVKYLTPYHSLSSDRSNFVHVNGIVTILPDWFVPFWHGFQTEASSDTPRYKQKIPLKLPKAAHFQETVKFRRTLELGAEFASKFQWQCLRVSLRSRVRCVLRCVLSLLPRRHLHTQLDATGSGCGLGAGEDSRQVLQFHCKSLVYF